MRLITPLAKVRGTGAAHEGGRNWWAERLTSLALVPLSLWMMAELLKLSRAGDIALQSWLASPYAALALAALMVVMIYHSFLGFRSVLEDYVHCKAMYIGSMIFLRVLAIVLSAGCLMAIVKLHFATVL